VKGGKPPQIRCYIRNPDGYIIEVGSLARNQGIGVIEHPAGDRQIRAGETLTAWLDFYR